MDLFQTGLPAYPVSPNISPISQRSDRVVYQSIDTQVCYLCTLHTVFTLSIGTGRPEQLV